MQRLKSPWTPWTTKSPVGSIRNLLKQVTRLKILFKTLKNLHVSPFKLEPQARRKRGGLGGGGLQPPNNLLKFADFVSEKGCKSQGRKNEDSNLYMFEEATKTYPKCNIFGCHASQKLQNFHGKTLVSRDRLLPSIAHSPKIGSFPTI